ncbi:hypothetical protein Ahy_A06g029818 [Arachis hypogaea]|uniref:Uncharacterized protein n=1 Tax=Arachis hypogaea TaxID=3818 RepID=A0A445CUD1_ARAHY|nr:hypothetical protein Ahy_A06g029818 [Arachis hypogaea]
MPNGLYNLVIGERIKREIREEWWNSLIVKLLEHRIFLNVIRRRLEVMWGKQDSLEVIDLGNKFFILWRPDFDPASAAIDNIAAWIHFQGLAIEYYQRLILEKIKNIIGKTIKLDNNIADVMREKFA